MNHTRFNIPAVYLLLFTVFITASAQADSIRLRASVRLSAGDDVVRLADIADIEGAEAERYAELAIAEIDDARAREITVRDVRRKLDEAGAHWGRINLNGRAVIIRPPRGRAASAPGAMAAVSLAAVREVSDDDDRPAADDRLAAEIDDDDTLRGALARYLIRGLETEAQNLRLIFDHHDDDLLDQSARKQRFELKPEGSLRSDRITFTVRVWSGGRIRETRQVALRPMLRLPTAVLQRDLDRNEMIDRGDFAVTESWLSPLQASMTCDPDTLAGHLARRRMAEGDVLRERSVRRPTLIERGERVNVRCLVGGVVITLQAEACADGADGEAIEFRKLGERDTFLATVTGAGEAVIDLSR
ncbi:MAG: flagellar basal body P-ring formation chaperone FlgA [Planctomycetota bacterium]|nr:flagellar basal body P-ring formation chaperone FlgA [Planctomycetota bacterium]